MKSILLRSVMGVLNCGAGSLTHPLASDLVLESGVGVCVSERVDSAVEMDIRVGGTGVGEEVEEGVDVT